MHYYYRYAQYGAMLECTKRIESASAVNEKVVQCFFGEICDFK